MKTIFDWLETLTWLQGITLYFVFWIVLCILILWIDHRLATAEQRAIKRRGPPKRKDDALLQFPMERTRIKDGRLYRAGRIDGKDIDPAYRSGHFHVPYNQRDKKGITR